MESKVAQQRGRWRIWAIAILVGPPILYVLSYGPATSVSVRSGQVGAMKIYQPLMAGGRQWPIVGRALASYVNLWMPRYAQMVPGGGIVDLRQQPTKKPGGFQTR